MKTAELTGAALDWAVAKAEGTTPTKCENRGFTWFVMGEPSVYSKPVQLPHYSTGPEGDDIIDREWIGTRPPWDAVALNGMVLTPPGWYATIRTEDTTYIQNGPTRRVAAMRAFCCAKLGDTVEIPESLLCLNPPI